MINFLQNRSKMINFDQKSIKNGQKIIDFPKKSLFGRFFQKSPKSQIPGKKRVYAPQIRNLRDPQKKGGKGAPLLLPFFGGSKKGSFFGPKMGHFLADFNRVQNRGNRRQLDCF